MITPTLVSTNKFESSRTRIEPWLWPNLLSLDAPVIAVLWQVLLARGLRVHLNPVEPLVLGLAVWSVYVSDRILDVLRPATGGWEPACKGFYRRHFRMAWTVGLGVTLSIVPLAYCLLRRSTFYAGLALTVPLLCYFGIVHLCPAYWRGSWPREAVVAALFTLGTFLGVWATNGNRTEELAGPAALFLLLCWANCSAIETWEWNRSVSGAAETPSASTQWAARHLSVFATCVALSGAAMGLMAVVPPEFAAASFGSGLLLAVLSARRSFLHVSVLRVCADAALCTPLLALLWVRAG